MKQQGHKGVRDMQVGRTPRDKGLVAMVKVVAYDNGKWEINGDFCQDDLTAGASSCSASRCSPTLA